MTQLEPENVDALNRELAKELTGGGNTRVVSDAPTDTILWEADPFYEASNVLGVRRNVHAFWGV
eukprot:1184197-Prorocentrum_minimum.AAC.3